MRVQHAHFAGAQTLDLIRTVAKLKDVAGETLDRKIFVERSDECFGRFENDPIVSRVGYRSAISNSRQSRAASATEAMIHRVMMKISPAPAASGGKPFRHHAHDFIEPFALELAER